MNTLTFLFIVICSVILTVFYCFLMLYIYWSFNKNKDKEFSKKEINNFVKRKI